MSRCICDEIYMQVMKQLSSNPSSESTTRGWELLKHMVQEVLPSPDVYLFLRAFIKRGRMGNQQPAEKDRARAKTQIGDAVTAEQKKDWRQQLLSQVREDILVRKQEEDEDDDGN